MDPGLARTLKARGSNRPMSAIPESPRIKSYWRELLAVDPYSAFGQMATREPGNALYAPHRRESNCSLRGAMYKQDQIRQIALDQRDPRTHIPKHGEPVCQIADRYFHAGIAAA